MLFTTILSQSSLSLLIHALSEGDGVLYYGLLWCVGFVMALQFRYQRAKMYRKVALGLKHHMSVSHGEIAG